MEFRFHDADRDVLVLLADGAFNSERAEPVVRELKRAIDGGARKLIVDCSRLEVLTSYGVSVLVRLHKRLRERSGDLKLASVRGVVARTLEITLLSSVFQIFPTVDAARASFKSGPPAR